jgi:hypothetical protein
MLQWASRFDLNQLKNKNVTVSIKVWFESAQKQECYSEHQGLIWITSETRMLQWASRVDLNQLRNKNVTVSIKVRFESAQKQECYSEHQGLIWISSETRMLQWASRFDLNQLRNKNVTVSNKVWFESVEWNKFFFDFFQDLEKYGVWKGLNDIICFSPKIKIDHLK